MSYHGEEETNAVLLEDFGPIKHLKPRAHVKAALRRFNRNSAKRCGAVSVQHSPNREGRLKVSTKGAPVNANVEAARIKWMPMRTYAKPWQTTEDDLEKLRIKTEQVRRAKRGANSEKAAIAKFVHNKIKGRHERARLSKAHALRWHPHDEEVYTEYTDAYQKAMRRREKEKRTRANLGIVSANEDLSDDEGTGRNFPSFDSIKRRTREDAAYAEVEGTSSSSSKKNGHQRIKRWDDSHFIKKKRILANQILMPKDGEAKVWEKDEGTGRLVEGKFQKFTHSPMSPAKALKVQQQQRRQKKTKKKGGRAQRPGGRSPALPQRGAKYKSPAKNMTKENIASLMTEVRDKLTEEGVDTAKGYGETLAWGESTYELLEAKEKAREADLERTRNHETSAEREAPREIGDSLGRDLQGERMFSHILLASEVKERIAQDQETKSKVKKNPSTPDRRGPPGALGDDLPGKSRLDDAQCSDGTRFGALPSAARTRRHSYRDSGVKLEDREAYTEYEAAKGIVLADASSKSHKAIHDVRKWTAASRRGGDVDGYEIGIVPKSVGMRGIGDDDAGASKQAEDGGAGTGGGGGGGDDDDEGYDRRIKEALVADEREMARLEKLRKRRARERERDKYFASLAEPADMKEVVFNDIERHFRKAVQQQDGIVPALPVTPEKLLGSDRQVDSLRQHVARMKGATRTRPVNARGPEASRGGKTPIWNSSGRTKAWVSEAPNVTGVNGPVESVEAVSDKVGQYFFDVLQERPVAKRDWKDSLHPVVAELAWGEEMRESNRH